MIIGVDCLPGGKSLMSLGKVNWRWFAIALHWAGSSTSLTERIQFFRDSEAATTLNVFPPGEKPETS